MIYYGTPQLWAWASYRVKRMRRYVDHVLCKLPFEEAWFRERGCHATYLGHPYFDELRSQRLDQHFCAKLAEGDGPLVTILPGSRTQEVESNLASFLEAAKRIVAHVRSARFAVAAFNPSQACFARQAIANSGMTAEVYVGRTAELISAADACLACSGSVSLELLFHAKPSVIHYRVGRVPYFLQQFLRKVRYITLVNLLTTDDPFAGFPAGTYDPADARDQHVLLPEYLTCTDKTEAIAGHIIGWLTDEAAYRQQVARLERLRDRVARGGASERGS